MAMIFRRPSSKSCLNLQEVDKNNINNNNNNNPPSTFSSQTRGLSRGSSSIRSSSSNRESLGKLRRRSYGLIASEKEHSYHYHHGTYPASSEVYHQRSIVRRARSTASTATSSTSSSSTWSRRDNKRTSIASVYSLIPEEELSASLPPPPTVSKSLQQQPTSKSAPNTDVNPDPAPRNDSADSNDKKGKKSPRGIVRHIMGLLSARSSSSSIFEAAPFAEIDNVMALPDSYVHSDLELLETGRFSDFTIQCRGRTWCVHSLVVCSRSGWFDQALKESSKRIVSLPENEPDDIDSLLLFLYSGDFSLTKWAKADNLYTAACHATYLADHFSIALLRRPALKQIAIQTKHRTPGDPQERHIMEAVRLEYTGPNLPQRALRQMLLLEAVRSRGRYRGPKFQGAFADEALAEEEKGAAENKGMARFREQVKKLEGVLLDNEGGDEHAVAKMLRLKYTFVSKEASHARWLRDFPPQGRVV